MVLRSFVKKKKKKKNQYIPVRGNINRTDVPYKKFRAIRITRACNPFHKRSLAEKVGERKEKKLRRWKELGKIQETRKC